MKKIILGPSLTEHLFNSFFSQVAVSEQYYEGTQVITHLSKDICHPCYPRAPVTEGEMARVIQILNSKKSCDGNGMSIWLLKHCFSQILKPFTTFINHSFAYGPFPNVPNVSKGSPVLKRATLTSTPTILQTQSCPLLVRSSEFF